MLPVQMNSLKKVHKSSRLSVMKIAFESKYGGREKYSRSQ